MQHDAATVEFGPKSMLARGIAAAFRASRAGVRKESLRLWNHRSGRSIADSWQDRCGMIRGKIHWPLGDFPMMTGDAGMPPKTDTVTAMRWTGSMDAEGFPPDAAWETVPAVQFEGTGRARTPIPRARRRCACSGLRIRCSWSFARSIAAINGLRRRRFARMARQIVGQETFAKCLCRAIRRSRGNIRNLKSRRTGIGSISTSISTAASTTGSAI